MMSDEPDNPPQDKPFQFSILQLIFLTVGVAVICAFGRAIGLRNAFEVIGLNLFVLLLVAFAKCCLSLPIVFDRYRIRNAFPITLSSLAVLFIFVWFTVDYDPMWRTISQFWLFAFPFSFIPVLTGSIFFLSGGFEIWCYLFCVAQIFVYVIASALAATRKWFYCTTIGILISHSVAVGVALGLIASYSAEGSRFTFVIW